MTAIFLTPLIVIFAVFILIFYLKSRIGKRIKLLDSYLDELSDFTANDWVYSINGYNGLALSDDSLCFLYITTKGRAHHKIIEYKSLIDVKINRIIVNLNFTDRVELQLIVDDLNMPMHSVLFFEGHMENKLVDYDSGVQKAIHWHALLKVCQNKVINSL